MARTVEQIVSIIEQSERAGIANVGPVLDFVRQAGSTGEAIEVLLQAGFDAATVFRWADVTPLEAEDLITDEELLQEGRQDRGDITELAGESPGVAAGNAGLSDLERALQEAGFEGYQPVQPGNYDANGQEIVAINADGSVVVRSPTGELVEGDPPGQDEQERQLLGGLPEGFAVDPAGDREMLERLGGPTGLIGQSVWDAMTAPIEARYYEGDQVSFNGVEWGGLAKERQSEISLALVAAGYLPESHHEMTGGQWSTQHARAMAEAMTDANINGETWDSQLRNRARTIEEAGGLPGDEGARGRTFVAPAYREPDYATLSQNVKALFRRGVGRDPLDWELALLADEMNQAYRSAYDADTQAQRQQFDAGNHAIEAAEGGADQFVAAGTVPNVDPMSRAQERFEQMYEDEIRLNEDRSESLQNAQQVFTTLTSASRLLGDGT